MNGASLYELATEMISGLNMNSVLFYSYLNTSRVIHELKRYWRALRALDTSATVGPSTSNITRITLPTNWRRYLPPRTMLGGSLLSPVQLVDSSGNVCFHLSEISMMEVQGRLGGSGLFAVDVANNQLVIVGIWDRTYTVHQHYQLNPGDITASVGWTPFTEDTYSRMLLHDAVAMYELGVDYDDQNARMGNANFVAAQRISSQMVAWDDGLTLASLGQ